MALLSIYFVVLDRLTEVVLSLLLSKFQFALSDKQIVWEMGTIATPAIKGKLGIPMMPMKVIPLQSLA